MENPDEAAAILHERLPDLDLAFLKAVVRDLNSENLWGVDGGLDPAIEEFTAELNMKLGNLPVAAPAKDVLDPRFVDAAMQEARHLPEERAPMAGTIGVAPAAAGRHGRLCERQQVLSRPGPARVRRIARN